MFRSAKRLWFLALLPIVGLGWAMKGAASWRPQVFGVEKRVDSVCLSPDGKTLLAWGGISNGHVWDVDTSKARFKVGSGSCENTGFSPDSSRFVLIDASSTLKVASSTLKVWNTKTGEMNKIPDFAPNYMSYICDYGFSPDGKNWLIAGGSGVVTLNVKSGRTVSFVKWRTKSSTKFTDINLGNFSPDRKTFMGQPENNPTKLKLFDVGTGREIRDLGVRDSFFFSSGPDFFWSDDKNGEFLACYRISDMKKMWRRSSVPDVFSPDGKLAYISTKTGLDVLDAHTGAKVRHLPGPLTGNFAPSPDGNWLYEARDGKIWKWRAR